jgi:hypothetical protein
MDVREVVASATSQLAFERVHLDRNQFASCGVELAEFAGLRSVHFGTSSSIVGSHHH